MAVSLTPRSSFQILYDKGHCEFDGKDISFENHPTRISIPVLYPGAGGGLDPDGESASSLKAHTNLTTNLLSIPLADPASDCGHADLSYG